MSKISDINPVYFDLPYADESIITLKAFNNACKKLSINREEASLIIGVDKATLSRNKKKGFSPDSKTGELCLQFVRAYRSLFAIGGGDFEFMRHWLRTSNNALSGVPIELMQSIQGLISVNTYLDAMRGKV